MKQTNKKIKIISASAMALQLMTLNSGTALAAVTTPVQNAPITSAVATDSYQVALNTNADVANTGSGLDLNLSFINNSSSSIIPAGTSYTLSISSEAIDYSTINFSDPTLNNFFTYQVDESAGTITLTLKKDIVGNGTQINPIIYATVTGKADQTYKIGASASDGTPVPITNDTITTTGSSAAYGAINSYWGIHEGANGNFIGKVGSPENTGAFSRSSNIINIFGEFNTDYQPWGTLVNGTDHFVTLAFNYDPRETLDPSSIVIYNKTTGYSITDYTTNPNGEGDKPIVMTDSSNHQFTVTFKSSAPIGGDQSQDVVSIGYSTNVTDDSLTYDNSMTLIDESGNNLDSFTLHSIFSKNGSSDVFPTITAKDLTYPLGQLSADNAKETLLKDSGAAALDTIDGTIDTSKISVDTSQVDFTTPGTYPVTYTITNSSGNTDSRSYTVTITAPVAGANVTVKYVDESGQPISDDVVKTGNVGDPYTSEQKIITGYTFKEVQGNPNGAFSDQPQTVTYVYTKNQVIPSVDKPSKPIESAPVKEQPLVPIVPINDSKSGPAHEIKLVNLPKQNKGISSPILTKGISSSTLPKTGDRQDYWFALGGALLVGIIGRLAFVKIRNKRN